MLRSVYSKWLWDNRRSIAIWAASIAAVGLGYAAFWPTIDSPAMQEALAAYPEGMLEALNYDNISTPAGYLLCDGVRTAGRHSPRGLRGRIGGANGRRR